MSEWTLDINPHWDRGGVNGDAVFARITDGPFTVFALTTETQMDRQETLDAALLCVAAPDLLEALKGLVGMYRGVCSNLPFGVTSDRETGRDLAKALAAIAKAEGRDE